MKVEYINPFIESVTDFFGSMLGQDVSRGDLEVSSGGSSNPRDIMAVVGFSGPARGTVALCCPTKTALSVINTLLGVDNTVVDETVTDGVAEVVNIIGGNAKARLTKGRNEVIDLSLPTVVRGTGFTVEHQSEAVWLTVPFCSGLGEFELRVSLAFSGE
jgi:chemotaxis protein CheX